MAAIFREIEIIWEGKTHRITPTMRLFNQIEQTISLSGLVHRLSTGNPPLSHLATVIGEMLRFDGVKVTDERIYQELMLGGPEAIGELTQQVVLAIFPQSEPKQSQKKKTRTKSPTSNSTGG